MSVLTISLTGTASGQAEGIFDRLVEFAREIAGDDVSVSAAAEFAPEAAIDVMGRAIARLSGEAPADMLRGIPVPAVERCAHCGQPRRGYGAVNDAVVCHASAPFPDCYRLVTVYGERLGQRAEALAALLAWRAEDRERGTATDDATLRLRDVADRLGGAR